MQYVADTALANHGADDGSEAPRPSPSNTGDEESLYVVELPTKTVEESLGQAVGLGLGRTPTRRPFLVYTPRAARRRRFYRGLARPRRRTRRRPAPRSAKKPQGTPYPS